MNRHIMVDLPRENPFGEAAPSGGRSNGQPGRQSRGGLQRYGNDEPDFDDGDYGGHSNVTQLGNYNPYASQEPSRPNRQGGPAARSGRPAPRNTEDGRNGNIIQLPHTNPFGPSGNRRPRIIEPEQDEDEEEEEDDYEDDYVAPAAPPRATSTANDRPRVRTNNLDRSQANGRQQRPANTRNQPPPAEPQDDDRLVVSWVDEDIVSPGSSNRRHRRRDSSSTSDSESYFALRPNRPRSVRSNSPGRGHHSNSHNRHHHSHHGHHDRHCHQCNHLALPPWQPPFPMPPADWSGYGAPRSPYSPAPPYPYARPLYANITGLPSLLEQCRVPYPSLVAPPVTLLRDIRAQRDAGVTPSTVTQPLPIDPEQWKNCLAPLPGAPGLLYTKLKEQAFSADHSSFVFRTLTNIVQVRFAERQNNEIVNRVHLVPRGRLAMGTIMADNPKIDVDMVLPSDFILRRWDISPAEGDPLRPMTVADALDLNPATINRAEVETAKLDWVFRAIWDQLNGSADGSIFPGGRDEAEQYLPRGWCSRHLDGIAGLDRLALKTDALTRVQINIFVKVSLSLYGQEMIVGVDQTSAKIGNKYQLIKTPRLPGVSLSEPTLSPNLRTAIYTLCLSQRLIKEPLPAIRDSHFHLALTALRKLEPSDSIFSDGEPFSIFLVVKAILKILIFLGTAYTCKPPPEYPFPLSSCTIMDTLQIQSSPRPIALPLPGLGAVSIPVPAIVPSPLLVGMATTLIPFAPLAAVAKISLGSALEMIMTFAPPGKDSTGSEPAAGQTPGKGPTGEQPKDAKAEGGAEQAPSSSSNPPPEDTAQKAQEPATATPGPATQSPESVTSAAPPPAAKPVAPTPKTPKNPVPESAVPRSVKSPDGKTTPDKTKRGTGRQG
ncbi:unnamed protein product [Rhizoctonia solani]|uniref:Uncharacterized protein n=1 Tax=Rhizoctonia solani TaxID=456999 RepID=A0A8H3E9W0_9AGAM|nr:unnamed protein product [Rhizoctonia solani]